MLKFLHTGDRNLHLYLFIHLLVDLHHSLLDCQMYREPSRRQVLFLAPAIQWWTQPPHPLEASVQAGKADARPVRGQIESHHYGNGYTDKVGGLGRRAVWGVLLRKDGGGLPESEAML